MASVRLWHEPAVAATGSPAKPRPRLSARHAPLRLSPEQRAALVRTFYGVPREWRQVRNRAIVLLVLAERLRPAEVAALRMNDARALHDDLRDRAGPVRRSQLTRDALATWLHRRARERFAGDWAFPLDAHGAPCSPGDVYRLLRRILRGAGVDPRQVGRLSVRGCVRRTSTERGRDLARPAAAPTP